MSYRDRKATRRALRLAAFLGVVGPITPMPTPAVPLLQGLTIPAGSQLVDMHADQLAGQVARFRVKNGAGEEIAVSTAAQAQAAGATKVSGFYDALNGAWVVPSADLDYIEINGLPCAKNNTGAQITLVYPAIVLSAFTGPTGYTTLMKYGGPNAGSVVNPWLIQGASVGRYVLSIPTNQTMVPTGRVNNGDSLSTGATPEKTAGRLSDGALELIGGAIDHAGTGTVTTYRHGEIISRDTGGLPTSTGGTATAGAATAGTSSIRVPVGATFAGCATLPAPPVDADIRTLGRRLQESCASALAMTDAWMTYWSNSAARVGNYTIVCYSTSTGSIYAHEIENATGRTTCVRALVNNVLDPGVRYSPDDHNQGHLVVAPNGQLGVVTTGHSNSTGTVPANGIMQLFWSATGRLADLVYVGRITAAQFTSLNYFQGWARGANEVGGVVVNDTNNAIVPLRNVSDGSVLAGWQVGRALVTQAVAPGNGPGLNQNQIYVFGTSPDPDTQVHFYMPNASNSNASGNTAVAFRRGVFDLASGNYLVNGVSVGNAWTNTGGAPLVDVTALPAIYVVPVGKSARILWASGGGDRLYFVECSDADGSDGQHYMLRYKGSGSRDDAASYDKIALGAAGAARDAARRYFPGIAEARHPYTGDIIVYRQANDGVSGQNGRVERLTIPDNAAPTIARTTIRGPVAKTMCTLLVPRNASAQLPYLSAEAGSYVSYTSQRADIQLGVAA